MRFQQDGLIFNNTFAMARDLRRQAVRDFPCATRGWSLTAHIQRPPNGTQSGPP
jgi:hypothetical protein